MGVECNSLSLLARWRNSQNGSTSALGVERNNFTSTARRRWEDNIKMDLQEVGRCYGDWMELAQDRDRWRALVGTVRNLRVPKMWGIS